MRRPAAAPTSPTPPTQYTGLPTAHQLPHRTPHYPAPLMVTLKLFFSLYGGGWVLWSRILGYLQPASSLSEAPIRPCCCRCNKYYQGIVAHGSHLGAGLLFSLWKQAQVLSRIPPLHPYPNSTTTTTTTNVHRLSVHPIHQPASPIHLVWNFLQRYIRLNYFWSFTTVLLFILQNSISEVTSWHRDQDHWSP